MKLSSVLSKSATSRHTAGANRRQREFGATPGDRKPPLAPRPGRGAENSG
jgi:hypothetical protein